MSSMIRNVVKWWRSGEPLDSDLEESIAWMFIIVAISTILLIG